MADDEPLPDPPSFPEHTALMAAYLRTVDDLQAAEV